MNQQVGAIHNFHDETYSQEWADRFVPTPERERLFSMMIHQLDSLLPGDLHILELGIGPGYLAERVLKDLATVTYEGADFSESMLTLAGKRLEKFSDRLRLTKLDLFDENWIELVTKPIGAVVSTWALHDLGSEERIAAVYKAVMSLLPEDGILLNGDFVKPEEANHEYEGGRITVSRHLELLRQIGFRKTECLLYLEKELKQPTAAQNYACLYAVR